MKKIWLTVLIFVLSLSLIGCGTSNNGDNSGGNDNPSTDTNSEITALINEISALPTNVEDNNPTTVYALYARYQVLSFSDRTQVTNRQTLLDLVNALNSKSDALVNQAIASIVAIGVVNLDSSEAIEYAKSCYNKLSDSEKAKVTNYSLLTSIITQYETLVNDELVYEVEELIKEIGIVSYDSLDTIEKAETAYNKLSSSLKSQVKNSTVLINARLSYDNLINEPEDSIEYLINHIKAIPAEPSYLYKEEVNRLFDLYSRIDQDKVVNGEFITYWYQNLNLMETLGINSYPDYTYDSMNSLSDAFVAEIYKYLLENNKEVLTSLNCNSLNDFIIASRTEAFAENELLANACCGGDYLVTPKELSTSTFLGYAYNSRKFVDFIDYMYSIYPYYVNKTDSFAGNGVKTLSFFIDVLKGTATFTDPSVLNEKASIIEKDGDSYHLMNYSFNGLTSIEINGRQIDVYNFTKNSNAFKGSVLNALIDEAINNPSEEAFAVVDKKIKHVNDDVFSELTKYNNYLDIKQTYYYGDKLASMTSADALNAMAYAYYYQGTQIEYDQHFRRNLNVMPENATAEETMYLDCSSFANSVFYATFGKNIHGVTSNVSSNSKTAVYQDWCEAGNYDVIDYFVVSNYSTDVARSAKINELKSLLQPGDMIVYQHNNGSYIAGHVMLYVGDQKFIHSTGKSISRTSPIEFYEARTTREEMYGSVLCESWNEVFESTGSRYVFMNTNEDKMINFGIFRPLMLSGITPTKEATARYIYSGVMVEKSANINNKGTVIRGNSITYSVDVENKNDYDVANITAVETLPDGATFVSATFGGKYNQSENKIYWDLGTLSANTHLTISYTLAFDGAIGTIITDDKTYVCGIHTNNLTHHIGSSLDLDKMNSYITSNLGNSSNGGFALAKAIYNAGGKTILSSFTSSQSVISDVLSSNKPNTSSSLYNQLVLFAGYNGISNNSNDRCVTSSELESGDLIITKLGSTYQCLYFQDASHVYGVSDGVISLMYQSEDGVSQLLLSLCVYDNAVIIRPCLN